MSKLIAISCAAFFIGLLISGAAQNPKRDNPEHGNREARGLGAELGLSKQKNAEIQEHMRKMRARMTDLHTRHEAAKSELNRLLDADPVNEDEIWQAVEKINNIQAEILKTRVSSRLTVNKKLTGRQKERMRELRKQMEQNRDERLKRLRERDSTSRTGSRKHFTPDRPQKRTTTEKQRVVSP